jgi:hypothetical protein
MPRSGKCKERILKVLYRDGNVVDFAFRDELRLTQWLSMTDFHRNQQFSEMGCEVATFAHTVQYLLTYCAPRLCLNLPVWKVPLGARILGGIRRQTDELSQPAALREFDPT